jgi:hypothetical protein
MRRREPTGSERLETWLRLWVTTFGGLGLSLVLTTRMSVIAGQVTDSSGVALAVVLLVLVGFGEGAALGALQWTALAKAWTPAARPGWIAASSVGVGSAWLLALVVGALAPRLLDLGSAWVSVLALGGGVAVGALIGAVQWWWALRRWFEGAAEWVVSSALGWCLAVVPVFVAAPRLLAGGGGRLGRDDGAGDRRALLGGGRGDHRHRAGVADPPPAPRRAARCAGSVPAPSRAPALSGGTTPAEPTGLASARRGRAAAHARRCWAATEPGPPADR